MNTYSELQQLIAAATARHDFDEVTRLAQIASQLKKLEEQKDHLLAAVSTGVQPTPPAMSVAQADPPRTSGSEFPARTGSRGGLTVELSLNGTGRTTICESTATDTLVVLMERLLAKYGIAALEKLMTLRVGRGPMISRNPKVDYVNRKTRELYAHHRILGTDMYVLTQTDNQQKVRNIKSALRLLGLPDTAFNVFLA